MPIYEYQCQACEHKLEKLQKISDEPLKDCPECGKQELKKLVSAAGFRLSGSGWYETDFKSKNQKNLSKSDKKPKAKSKAEGKSKSKSSSGDK
ncbi:MAG: zinc ribbon domain-containing protein [Gammaproteobacteria bacterium]